MNTLGQAATALAAPVADHGAGVSSEAEAT